MNRFQDVYMPEEVPGYPCISSPRWSTSISQSDSGAEQALRRWAHPLHHFSLPEAVREFTVLDALHSHWLIMGGPAHTFPWRDPLDFASVGLEFPNREPVISAVDQFIGTGDGNRISFPLLKKYERGAYSYTRNIYFPVVSSVLVSVDGNDPLNLSPPLPWQVSRPGGVVTFDIPPPPGAEIRAGYYFDVQVRFTSDDAFDGIVRTFEVGGFADVNLTEVRYCNDGST